MVSSSSAFVKSSLDVGQNAVKSILFRLAAMLLQYTVYKMFALIASRKKAFMPYLMFTEDAVQKTLFVAYNFLRANGMLVLSFAALFAVAGVFDTFLWYLDAPGYVPRPSLVNARTVAPQQLLPQPSYLVQHSTTPGNVTAMDAQIDDVIGGVLFQAGLNFTLTTDVRRGRPRVVSPTRDVADAGPRIWLDDEGFSVSADTYLAYSAANTSSRRPWDCAPRATGNASVAWSCTYSNHDALPALHHHGALEPEVHWDDASDRMLQSRYIQPPREDNPWHGMGKGGGTVLMKQLVTVTKGRRRHALLHTAFKATMLADYQDPAATFTEADITDLLRRAWHPAYVDEHAALISNISRRMVDARARNRSSSEGFAAALPHSVQQDHFELLNVAGFTDDLKAQASPHFTAVRVTTVNITLVRSDTLTADVQPLGECSKFHMNQAVGGRGIGTDCYKEFGGRNQRGARFLGQVDNTAMLLVNGFFGDRGPSTPANALNTDAMRWWNANDARLDALVLARAYIMAFDPALVTLRVSRVRPAMSHLQLLLVVAAAVAALLGYAAFSLFATEHYASSLLANLVATTADGAQQPKASRKPRYLRRVPDIRLTHEGDCVVMENGAGVYRLDRSSATAAATTGFVPAAAAAGAAGFDVVPQPYVTPSARADLSPDAVQTASASAWEKSPFIVSESKGR
jgi:hypothetical protein